MPIPLLFIAAAVPAVIGTGKTIKAGLDQRKAKTVNYVAQKTIDQANNKVNESRDNCKAAIDNLGKKKISILNGSMDIFIKEFEQINKVELSESAGFDELNRLFLDEKSIIDLKELKGMTSSLAGGIASGALTGALTAFGAYGAASTFATASTGTAIASLSGAAASNATLSFFGGGALSIGGLGVTGGVMVLGMLVTGPALAIMGFVSGAKAKKNLDNALANYEKANELEEELKTVATLCNGIRRRADMLNRFLIRLQAIFDPLVVEMSSIINDKGTDYSKYSDEEKKCIASAMSLAGAIKAVLDTSILDEDGNLTKESEDIFNVINAEVDIAN